MVKIISLFLTASILVGCCEPIIKTEIREVRIPVPAQCKKPKEIPVPNLPINDLTSEDYEDYEKVAKTYASSLKVCMSYAEQQKAILDSYRKEVENGSKKEDTEK